jgi:putative hydrolase of the HAD superfamily
MLAREPPPRGLGGMIRAITVDCWGTLLLDGPVSDERYTRQRLAGIEAILARSGVKVSRQELNRAYDASGRRLARIWAKEQDVPVRGYVTMLLEALDRKLLQRLEPATIDEMVEAYSVPALQVPPALDPGAAAACERLVGRGIALGVVSNTMRTPGVVLRRIFEAAGVLGLFKVLVFSDECGIRKPDPEIFRLALRQVGASPEEALHVGDDAVLDVEGARQAGMGVIQVSHDGRATGPVKPDAVITALGELPDALERLRLRS